jgi:hypothetical protein
MTFNQNYPNPAITYTSIEVLISKPSKIEIIIYDINGMKVGTTISNTLTVGKHTIECDVSKLNPGIYWYQLQSDRQITQPKAMVVCN